jgi:uncharacterized protein with gpF-like domain
MRFDLTAMARRALNPRRSSIALRDIVPPATLASDLYLSVYKPVVDLWTRRIDTLTAEYERSLSALTTDSALDITSILEDALSEFDRLFILLRPNLRRWAVQVEKYQRGKWRGAVLSATKVDLETLIGPQDVAQTLEQTIEWNVALVWDVNAQVRQRIAAATFDGLRNRTPVREVAKAIREAVGMSRDRSTRIASDQLSKLSNSLADERRRQAGLDRWQWKWSHKKHGRPEHIARDGKIYAETEAGADPANGVLAPPSDRPGQLPHCGCRSLGVLVFA